MLVAFKVRTQIETRTTASLPSAVTTTTTTTPPPTTTTTQVAVLTTTTKQAEAATSYIHYREKVNIEICFFV